QQVASPSTGSAAGSAAGSPTAVASSAAAATPAPKKGGTAVSAQVTDLNLNTGHPFVLWPQDGLLLSAVHEPLIRYRDSIQPEMVLAERFEFNSDRSGVTIALKPGLTFHNGAAVTPEDVFFGIDVILNPAKHGITANFQIINFAKMITAMKKVDDRTMQFTLDQPRVNFADFFAQMEIVQAASYDKLITGKDIQGTGPYKFASWNPGQGYRLEPNKSWWGASTFGGPWLDAIESKIFADFDAIGLAYQAGSIDWAAVTAQVAKPFQSKNQTAIGHKAGVNYVGCVVTNPLLKDSRVRQALFAALDRPRFVSEVQEGFGSVTVQPWPASSPAFDPALEAPMYDPARARDLLKQAGFTQDRPLML
ncbi:MAG: ABC transporter substrate-binding protein, partial [Mycobacterium sp.]